MAQIPNMNWMGDQPTGSAYDVYQYYLGGGNPNATPGGGGGGGTGIMQGYQSTGGEGGAGQSLNMADFNTATMARQNRINNPSKIGQWAYDNIPGINQPYTQEQLMTHGATQQFGGPGILGFLGGKLDKYHTLPKGDQAFISSKMGYSDPNTNMANKDPFGINVRSMFGNYADYSMGQVDKLGTALTKSAAKRGLTFDPVTGKVTGGDEDEIADWEKQTKSMHDRFGFYGKNKTNIQGFRSDVGLIEKARRHAQQQAQGRVDKSENKINRDAAKGDSKSGASTVNPNSAYGKKQGYTGGHANPHTNTGWSGSSKSSSSKSSSSKSPGHPSNRAQGGMITEDLTKDPEYRGWKKMYESNPELGSMHDKHPAFIKFYKQHERDQKKFGGLAGLLYG